MARGDGAERKRQKKCEKREKTHEERQKRREERQKTREEKEKNCEEREEKCEEREKTREQRPGDQRRGNERETKQGVRLEMRGADAAGSLAFHRRCL